MNPINVCLSNYVCAFHLLSNLIWTVKPGARVKWNVSKSIKFCREQKTGTHANPLYAIRLVSMSQRLAGNRNVNKFTFQINFQRVAKFQTSKGTIAVYHEQIIFN